MDYQTTSACNSEDGETECSDADFETTAEDDDFTTTSSSAGKRKNSFVWKYFRPVEGSTSFECVICKGCVGKQTSNLARHLSSSHDITKEQEGLQTSTRGRPSRSFIWKYCTKEDAKHARCHLCKKLLYFGGGNTANIAKHLRRKHLHQIQRTEARDDEEDNMNESNEIVDAVASIDANDVLNGGDGTNSSLAKNDNNSGNSERRERKGASYVWNYCEKLSRHTIRCNLCNKVMSFHGTANVITHLQRKHNIMRKMDSDDTFTGDASIAEKFEVEPFEDSDFSVKRRGRSAAATSSVWKYCTRVGKYAARCGFCKKDLSYQGTSNLQRHLHRMHNVVTQVRSRDYEMDEERIKQFDTNFITDYCSMLDDDKVRCNMCASVWNSNNTEEIKKHLTITHAIEPRRPDKKPKCRSQDCDDSSEEDYEDYHNTNWTKVDMDYIPSLNESNIKKDESIFNEFIEEDPEHTNFDEHPFDSGMLHEFTISNPLSPKSSDGGTPDRMQRRYMNNKKLRLLNKERIRVEIEYFREKAAYYRMQKYLAALQAKKVRIELERLEGTNLNGAYTINVGEVQENLQAQ